MKPEVDESRCIGCGLCVQMCPGLFQVDDRQIAVVIGVVDPGEALEKLEATIEYCPVQAIRI